MSDSYYHLSHYYIIFFQIEVAGRDSSNYTDLKLLESPSFKIKYTQV